MAVTILQPFALHEVGKRKNNEDAIFPQKGHANIRNRLFLVCDGVGGNNKGEVASQLLSHTFAQYFTTAIANHEILSKSLIQEGIKAAEKAIQNHIVEHPGSEGMASTFTMLYLFDNQAVIAWVGDSRIYHIRPTKGILYRSMDHSIVQELLNAGELTEEEARVHPQRNVLLKAVTGDKPVKVDMHTITNLKTGDYFFLCSDGILEGITDEELSLALSKTHESNEWNEQFTRELHNICLQKSKDNYSMYLVQLESVGDEDLQVLTNPANQKDEQTLAFQGEKETSELNAEVVRKAEQKAARLKDELDTASYDELVEENAPYKVQNQSVDSPSGEVAKNTLGWMKWMIPLLLLGAVLVGLGLGYVIFGRGENTKEETTVSKPLNPSTPPPSSKPSIPPPSSNPTALEGSQFQEHLDNADQAVERGDIKNAISEYEQAIKIANDEGLEDQLAKEGLKKAEILLRSGNNIVKEKLQEEGPEEEIKKIVPASKDPSKSKVDTSKAEIPTKNKTIKNASEKKKQTSAATNKQKQKQFSQNMRKGMAAFQQKKYQEALDFYTKAKAIRNTKVVQQRIEECKRMIGDNQEKKK